MHAALKGNEAVMQNKSTPTLVGRFFCNDIYWIEEQKLQ